MGTLEDSLQKVEELRRDLSAEAEPSMEEREAARAALRQIYDSSEWCTARYAAGKSLGIGVDGQLEQWLEELKTELFATRQEPRTYTVFGGYEEYGPKGWYGGSNRVDTSSKITTTTDMVDREKRLKAVRDVGGLLRLSKSPEPEEFLRTIYNASYYELLEKPDQYSVRDEVDGRGSNKRTGFIPRLRRQAGKELGYCWLRTFEHETRLSPHSR